MGAGICSCCPISVEDNIRNKSQPNHLNCSRGNCTAIHDLTEYCKLYNYKDSETQNELMESTFNHYTDEHAQYEERLKNKCSDNQCDYTAGSMPLSQIQSYHAYFYHSNEYNQLKKQRTLHYMQTEHDCMLTPAPQSLYTPYGRTSDISEPNTDLSVHTVSLHTPDLSTPSTNTPLTPSVKISIARSSSLNRTSRMEKLLNDTLSPLKPVTKDDSMTHDVEPCSDSFNCPKLQSLLNFSKNVDPNHESNESYDEESMRSYWDHCCDAHAYRKYACIHMNNGDGYRSFCEFSRNLDDTALLLVVHRHFYHENIMQKDEDSILYNVKTIRGQQVIDKFQPTMDAVLKHHNDINTTQLLEFGYVWSCERKMAKFKNPKQEILENDYGALNVKSWNQLFKSCKSTQNYTKVSRTRTLQLKLKEVICLKLYTDYDEVQNAYRKCYRENDKETRMAMQSQFYHWNQQLQNAVGKSQDIITNTVYNGINANLTIPTLAGKYHGPVSTTRLIDVARGFAGSDGKVLELYPSFGKKGLDVAWLSNFPDEREVLYFDVTFNIKNIYAYTDDIIDSKIRDINININRIPLLSAKTVHDLQYNTKFLEQSILKALQTINIDSTILSFNEIDKHDEEELKDSQLMTPKISPTALVIPLTTLGEEQSQIAHFSYTYDDEGVICDDDEEAEEEKKEEETKQQFQASKSHTIETFDKLRGSELISIFYLLYLQYKPTEWTKLVKCREDVYTQIALAKYRDTFAQLTQNVNTIRMEQSSELIKYFFSMNMHTDDIIDSIPSLTGVASIQTAKELAHIVSHSGKFEGLEYHTRFDTIVKLFPECKSLSIDGDTFDWTLTDFISFLKAYNLDFSGVKLQDIFFRFKPDYLVINADVIAKKKLKEGREQLAELSKLGWKFITPSHIHRSGFEPEEEKPFLSVFMTEGRLLHYSYSKRLVGTTLDNAYSLTMQQSVQMEGDYSIIRSNEKHLFLSQHMINRCGYKDTLITLLENRAKHAVRQTPIVVAVKTPMLSVQTPMLSIQTPDDGHIYRAKFNNVCGKVETLVLYPIHEDIIHIFYDTFAEKKRILSFSTISVIFPNVTDIYLRDTTFNERICRNLLQFIQGNNKRAIKRIFYSVEKACQSRDVQKLKLRLNEDKWDFSVIEQVAFEISSNGIDS